MGDKKIITKRPFIINFVIFFIVTILYFEIGLCSPPKSKEWILSFSDEFTENKINEAKWNYFTGYSSPKYRDAIYTKDDAYIENGNLVFRIINENGNFKTSWLNSEGKFEQTFGYCEIKCNFSQLKSKGLWVAFWLFKDDGLSYDGIAENGCEIDIVEYPWMNDKTNHSIHWGKSKSQAITYIAKTPNLREGYHTFGLEWNPYEYIFYINQKEVWRTEKGISYSPLPIQLSVEIQANVWGDGGDLKTHGETLPDYFLIEYIRVYKQVYGGEKNLK